MVITDKYTFFWKDKIAQWNMTNFYEDHITYCCAEQYMMYKKALLFKDFDIATKLLIEKDPSTIQKMGREIKDFNEYQWKLNREKIVFKANLLKFSQNKELKDRLLSTNNTLLVEASPYDLIWGVGLRADDPLILDEKNWRGLNLLGKNLTKVRDFLKSIE